MARELGSSGNTLKNRLKLTRSQLAKKRSDWTRKVAEANYPAFKEAMTQVILKQAQDDFEALGYKRTGDDQETTFTPS